MKHRQKNLLTTGHNVAEILRPLPAVSANPALQAALTALDNELASVAIQAGQQADPLPPRTRERDQVFAAAASATYVVARLVLGHALATDQAPLAGQVDIAPSAMRKGRITLRVQTMRRVLTAAQENPVANVTPAMLTDLEARIEAAEALISATRSHLSLRRAATENLVHSFRRIERLLFYTFDPLMEVLRSTDPDAFVRYQTARQVIDYGRRSAADSDSVPDATVAAPSSLATQPLAA